MDFDAVLRAVDQASDAAMVEAVRDVCEDLLSESRDEVPYDQGDLSNSGKVTVAAGGNDVEGAVSYDTPYAVIQHEATDFAHQDGRKAHYLGDPFRANSERYLHYLAGKIGEAH
jgi:hypothetical protein